MADESILINGKGYQFSACRLELFGLKRVGFTQADYGDKLEMGEGRGASQVALASSDGVYKADPLKVTLPKPEPLPRAELARFQMQTQPMLAKLQMIEGGRVWDVPWPKADAARFSEDISAS